MLDDGQLQGLIHVARRMSQQVDVTAGTREELIAPVKADLLNIKLLTGSDKAANLAYAAALGFAYLTAYFETGRLTYHAPDGR